MREVERENFIWVKRFKMCTFYSKTIHRCNVYTNLYVCTMRATSAFAKTLRSYYVINKSTDKKYRYTYLHGKTKRNKKKKQNKTEKHKQNTKYCQKNSCSNTE